MRKKFFIFCIISLAGLSNLVSFSALAQTNIEQIEDCHYQIMVKIVFNFKDESAQEKADFLLQKWAGGMDRVWNGNYGSKKFGDNCRVDYSFELIKMADGNSCRDYPDYHCINVVSAEFNQRGNVADAAMVMANSQQNSWGEWTENLSGINAAHEVGHMMGLGEEYHYEMINNERKWFNDNYKETGPQSIMAQTWGEVAAFSEHAFQIMSQAGFESPTGQLCPKNELEQLRELALNFYSAPLENFAIRPEIEKLKGALIKGQTDPAVYFVDQNGKLRWLANEQVAQKLIGDNWASQIIWFNDAIIYTYQFGEPIKE